MQSFSYIRVSKVEEALLQIRTPHSRFVAGGTNLVDLMKGDVERPSVLIDITHLPLTGIERSPDGGLRIGALVRNSDLANDAAVRRDYPLLAEALLAGASPQLRNMATVGGNLLQRTRCYYFTDAAFPACNKRLPDSGCGARSGVNRIHAIFGASEQCVATHPSDMCVALAALDATVEVAGGRGARRIAIGDLHRLPGGSPQRDTNLASDELIVAVTLPPSEFAAHSHYLKVRDRASYAFALVSVAAALRMDQGRVMAARVVLGGVAHKPWRAEAAERRLVGGPLDDAAATEAAAEAVRGAVPLRDNAFKVELARRSVMRALRTAAGIA